MRNRKVRVRLKIDKAERLVEFGPIATPGDRSKNNDKKRHVLYVPMMDSIEKVELVENVDVSKKKFQLVLKNVKHHNQASQKDSLDLTIEFETEVDFKRTRDVLAKLIVAGFETVS